MRKATGRSTTGFRWSTSVGQLIQPRTEERVTQHVDIVPTVLDLIGYDAPFFAFGHSALRPASPPYAIWTNNGLYSITSATSQLQFDGERIIGTTTLATDSTVGPERNIKVLSAT